MKGYTVIKHALNFYPEAKAEDFEQIRRSIESNGFDSKHPILLYEGKILDGWNRFQICEELGIKPKYEEFTGSREEAVAEVIKRNSRRNLTKSQNSALAAEGEELIAAIQSEAAKRKKEAGGDRKSKKYKESVTQKVESPIDRNKRSTTQKLAEMTGTNRQYVSDAIKIKKEAPEVFEKVKAGKLPIHKAKQEIAKKPTEKWTKSERDRQKQVQNGLAVVANQQQDKNLIAWAEKKGLAVRIDRGSKFGNPFVMDKDGQRSFVCESYEHYYLPRKPSILSSIESLKGKVLICHCFPEQCHGDTLASIANEK